MSSNKIPLVSIGLIVFNGENYLRKALDGLIVQDYENFELLISDNASTDSTKDICEEYARIDKRIKYSRNASNLGGANSFKVLEMARGEFFMWAAHDDNWDKSYVSKCVAKLQEYPKAVMCSSEITFIDTKGNPLVHGGYGSHVNIGSRPGMSIEERVHELINRMGWFAFYGVWRTEAIRKIDFLADTIQGYGSDVLLLQYMILVGDFVKVEEKLFYYRVADKEKTTEDYLLQIHGSLPASAFKAYTYLAIELYKIILESDLDQQIKSTIREVFLYTLSRQNDDWFGRIAREHFPQGFHGGVLEKEKFIERYVLMQAELEYSNSLAERKKVLVFFPHNIMPPQNGAHKRCFDLLLSLRAAGHEVTLVGSALFTDNPWQKESIEKLKTEHGINVLLHQELPEDRAYIQSYNPDLDWRYFTPPSLVQFFMKVYDTLHPEIVYINYALWAGLVEDKKYDTSILIIEMHDMITSNQKMQNYARSVCNNPASTELIPPDYIDEKFYEEIDTAPSPSEFKAYDRFDIVTAIASTEAAIVSANTSRPEVITLPHVFKANYRENTYSLSPVFVIGSNLFNFQGYAYFVNKILPIIREKYPDFVLRVVGGGCKHLHQVPGVELVGFVPDLEPIYENASFAICPLIGGTGQQIKIVEAMSYGVPVVALANVSTNSPIINEQNGFVAENAEGFANYMMMLLNDKKLCVKLGEAARQTIFEAHFKNKNNAVLNESIKRKLITVIHKDDLAQIDEESDYSEEKLELIRKTKNIKIAGEDKNEKDLTQIDSVSEFAIQLGNVIKEFKPKKLMETGTYLGMGTTTVVTTALKENGLNDSQFFSIEVKPENHLAARKNLTENGLINYVTLLNGVSMPRKSLPTIEEIERTTVKELEFEGIYVDHQESERARLYYNETNYDNVEEDLIGKCLITFENKPDFVLLDSGGHMGNLEFNYLIERLEKECIVALDDVNHIKHRKSYMQIQNDSRFELITSSDEKFGFCIAKFTPQKDRIVPVQSPIKIHPKKILFIRTDAVGDNILASVVLKGIKEKYPKADITIICNEFISELYEYSPYVKNVIGINRTKFEEDDEYKGRFLTNIKSQKYDLAINPIYSSDSIVDILLFTAGAKQTIRIDGNSENFVQGWQWVKSANEKATHVIRTGAGWRSEFDRHKDFLNGFGVNTADIEPEMWLSKEDEEFADKVFSDNNLDPDKTIVLFAGAKYDLRVFKNYGKALSDICEKNNFAVIAVGSRSDEKINHENLNDINAFTLNLSGNTTLRQTAAIIKKSRLAIGAETGNAHIACAVGTPNVILIGGGHFGRFMPYSKLTSLVTLPLDCFGCNWICQYNRTHCVKDVNPELLSRAIEKALQNVSTKPRVYIDELPDGEGRARFIKMLSRYINLDNVELLELKADEDSTYTMSILYLAEELIQSNEIENAKKLLSNILLLESLNVDALNNLAVIEILSENWTNALDILVKTLEIDPDNDVALGNLQFINEKLNPTITSSDDESGEVENKKSDQVISRSGEIKLSAIVSVYNAERFIRGCMEDLISQTIYQHGEMEIVIVETGSQQNEKEIIDEYVNKYPNINYIRIPERETVYQAWNRAVRAAKGKYLTNANADDRHRVNGLERLVELLEKNPDKVLAYGDSVVSEVENDSFENCTVLDYLLWPDFDKMEMLDKCYIGPHPVWRKSLHDEFGYFDESYKSSADYEFWLRIAQKYEFIHLKELVGVYWWDNNSVSRNGNIPIIETREIKKRYNRIYLIGESDKLLPIESIVSWEIIRGTKTINSVQHKLKINCPECSNKFVFDSVQEFKKTPGVSDVYCPKCKQTFTFSEDLFAEYLKSKYDGLESAEVTNENNKLKVAYFLKDAHVISGGAKVALKHISWLMRLGVEVVVYSFESEPKWIDFKINFKQLKSFGELDDKEFNKIIVFSIFEVPGIIQKVHPSRVFLFCQGFEGYHYGKYLEDVRSSKFIIDEMHHLPIGVINVSPHLTNLFDNRYAKTSYYIPNGIDHNTFKPRVKFKSRDKSIVFIGSPFHFLKGFPFLVNTLKAIQKSSHKIEDLKLKIVMGFNPDDKIGMAKSLEKEADIKVEIMSNLSSSEVSTLLQNSSLLICSSIYEGFSLPILEAMASGTPAITTRNMGAEGFCIDEKNSFIVNYGDFEKLGGRILEIMRDMTACYPLVVEGINTSYKFSERNTLNSLKDVFEAILETSFEQSNIDNLLETVREPDELSYEEVKDILIPSEEDEKNEVKDLVSIIIPTFNKSEYVIEAVKSIEANTKSDYEIIVVDDGSTENLIEPFKNDRKVTVIRNEENSGFPISVNRGFQAASGKYILLVNNDTVCTKGSIDRMIEIANTDEKIGLVGVMSNEASGPQMDNKAQYRTMNQMHAYANQIRLKKKGEHYVFPRIAFLFTLIKREVIDKIGGLDERFSPGYYEDDDFCLRAQLGGFKGIIAPDIFIHHHGSVSFSSIGEEKRQKLSDTNRQKFKDKWGGTTEEVWLKGVDITLKSIKYSINKDNFSKHFERALQHVEDNEIELADIEIEKAITSYSESERKDYKEVKFSNVLDLAGKIAYFNQDYEKAKLYYEEELKAEPESSTACQGLGEVFYTLEMMEEAKTMFEWAVKNNLQNAKALSRLTKVNLELGLPENDNSLLDFDPREIIANAENLIEQEKYDEAEALLLELLDKEPNYIDALNDLSVIYILQNDFENALKLINQVITIDSANEIAKGNFDYINQQLGEN